MIYLLYEDEKGWKVARRDGRLDDLTTYYKSSKSAAGVLICARVEWRVY